MKEIKVVCDEALVMEAIHSFISFVIKAGQTDNNEPFNPMPWIEYWGDENKEHRDILVKFAIEMGMATFFGKAIPTVPTPEE